MTEPGFRWLHTPAEWQMAISAEAHMRRFERLTLDLITSPGVSASEAGEAAAALMRSWEAYAAEAPSVANEPFLQPDCVAAPVVGAPGEPIALMRREGGA